MSHRLPIPVELHRIRHTRGERLRSADLRDALAVEEQLRWWHNRAKHHSYGIASGLTVTTTTVSGDPAVHVKAGLAYDCFGRELFLCASRTVPLPAEPSPQLVTLVIHAAPGHDVGKGGDGAASLCGAPPSTHDCLVHDAGLTWRPGGQPDVRAGVPLVRADRDESATWRLAPASIAARPAARARTGRGSTPRGATNWQPWTADVGEGELFLGVETVVDTTPAGFGGTPHYFAHVEGSIVPAPLLGSAATRPLVPLLHLTDAAPTGFRARIMVPLAPVPPGAADVVRRLYKRDVALCWLGIEPGTTSRCGKGSP